MEFAIENMCHTNNEKRRKLHRTEGIELPNQDKSERSEKKPTNNWEYWKRTPLNMQEMKEKKEYLRRTRKLLKTKLHSRNLIKEINSWAVTLVRYSGPFLKWTREPQQMDQRTRKHMTMHKVVHPWDDIDRLSCTKKKKKKKGEDLQAFKIASMHRHNDWKTT